jgi:hypothetical protein
MEKIERKIIPLPLKEVGIVKYPYDMTKEIEFIKNLKYENNDPDEEESHLKSTHTDIKISYDKFVLHRPELKKIFQFCQEQLDSYVDSVLRSSTKLKINTSWIARSDQGSIIEPHVHNSIICGCIYFQVPDDTTPIVLNVHNCLDVREGFPMEITKGD